MTARASAHEVNFDCLVGPTHHFGGLSHGNLASTKNKAKLASPKRAALQGLEKMRYLSKRGFMQGVLPPHPRPHMPSFHNLGFRGSDTEILYQAYKKMPQVFSHLCSSSAMWAANAATISPSFDSRDNKTHISPANLITMLHRSIEADFTYHVFRQIFANTAHFMVHPPLLAHDTFSDEGAANHNRLVPHHARRGLQIFVYGKESAASTQRTKRYPARQSKLANDALIERHQLQDDFVLTFEQNCHAIDEGAFHNDVVAVTNQNVLLCHELAFTDQATCIAQLRAGYQRLFGEHVVVIEIKNTHLPIHDAVSSYLFNSQLLSKPEGGMLLFAPTECRTNAHARAVVDTIIRGDNPINEVQFFDVSESMANGGGPACLRLRVLLTDDEIKALTGNVLLTDDVYETLVRIIDHFYVDELSFEHFFDRAFLDNCERALREIASTLKLDMLYSF